MPTCATPYCKNAPRKQRRYCHKCRSRKQRAKNPMRAAFEALRFNARRRGKKFTISYAYFQQFCYETAYIAGKGRSSVSFTVDRERDELGYVEGNLRVTTNAANSAKAKKKLVYDWEYPEYTHVVNW